MLMFAERVFQTEGIASTKAVGQEHTQNIYRTTRSQCSRNGGNNEKMVGGIRKLMEDQITKMEVQS